MKNKKLSIFIIIFILLIVAGYFILFKNKEEVEIANISASSISRAIKDNIVFKDELIEIDKDMMSKYYKNINLENVEDASVYVSASGATTEEIAVFIMKRKGLVVEAKESINNRKKDQIESFKNYVPEEVYKIEQSVIKENENIVVFVSTHTPDDVDQILENVYNGNIKIDDTIPKNE